MEQSKQPDEQAVLVGLGKRKLAERRRWLVPAAQSGSGAVFTKLASMYPTKNALRADVLVAMQELNSRAGGAFGAQFEPVVRAEFARLQAEGSNSHGEFLLEMLWYAARAPQGLNGLAHWARELATAQPSALPQSLAAEISTVADLVLATGGDQEALARAIAAWRAGGLLEGAELIEIALQQATPLLWEPLQQQLREAPERPDWPALMMGYLDYAARLKRQPDAALVSRYQQWAGQPFAEQPLPGGRQHG